MDAPPQRLRVRAAVTRLLAPALSILLFPRLLTGVRSLPFWGDRSVHYALAARWQVDHGLFSVRPVNHLVVAGLRPAPLLTAVTALAFRVSAPGPVTAHTVVLACAVVTLWLTVSLGARLVHGPAGVAAAVLLACTPGFLSASALFVPGVAVTACTVACVLALAHGRRALAVAAAGAVMLLDPTAGVAPVAVAVALAPDAVRTRSWRAAGLPLGMAVAWLLGRALLSHHGETLLRMAVASGDPTAGTAWGRTLAALCTVDGRHWALLAAGMTAASRCLRAEPVLPSVTLPAAHRTWAFTATACVVLGYAVLGATGRVLPQDTLPALPLVLLAMAGVLVPGALPVGSALRVRAVMSVLVLAVVCATGLARRRVPSRETDAHQGLAWLDAVQAHQGVCRRMDAMRPVPVVLADGSMVDGLQSPWLGWVRRPYTVVDLHGYQPMDPGPTVDAVLAWDAQPGWHALRDHAARLAMHPTDRETAGDATVVLWTR